MTRPHTRRCLQASISTLATALILSGVAISPLHSGNNGIEIGCEDNCFDLPDYDVFWRSTTTDRRDLQRACNEHAEVKRKKYDYCVILEEKPTEPVTVTGGMFDDVGCMILVPDDIPTKKAMSAIYKSAKAECKRVANHYLKNNGLIRGPTEKRPR